MITIEPGMLFVKNPSKFGTNTTYRRIEEGLESVSSFLYLTDLAVHLNDGDVDFVVSIVENRMIYTVNRHGMNWAYIDDNLENHEGVIHERRK